MYVDDTTLEYFILHPELAPEGLADQLRELQPRGGSDWERKLYAQPPLRQRAPLPTATMNVHQSDRVAPHVTADDARLWGLSDTLAEWEDAVVPSGPLMSHAEYLPSKARAVQEMADEAARTRNELAELEHARAAAQQRLAALEQAAVQATVSANLQKPTNAAAAPTKAPAVKRTGKSRTASGETSRESSSREQA